MSIGYGAVASCTAVGEGWQRRAEDRAGVSRAERKEEVKAGGAPRRQRRSYMMRRARLADTAQVRPSPQPARVWEAEGAISLVCKWSKEGE